MPSCYYLGGKEKDASNFFKRQSVLGILLGYGKENAEQFERLCTLKKWNPFFGFSLRTTLLTPSIDFSSIDEELNYIEKNLTFFLTKEFSDFPTAYMIPLGFRANQNSLETIRLKKRYKEEYRNIVRIYREGDFLEVTIKQLMK